MGFCVELPETKDTVQLPLGQTGGGRTAREERRNNGCTYLLARPQTPPYITTRVAAALYPSKMAWLRVYSRTHYLSDHLKEASTCKSDLSELVSLG